MGKRTNNAVWDGKRWRIAVQKDGVRKYFYSSKPGKRGKCEANAKADRFLDEGVADDTRRVDDLYKEFIKDKELSTCARNSYNIQNRYDNYVKPIVGGRRLSTLTTVDIQHVINKAFGKGLAEKTLKNLRGDLSAFLKYCRLQSLTTLTAEGVTIPASAKRSQKTILQPSDLQILFSHENTMYRGKVVYDYWIHLYRIAVLTGMRPGELIGLRWCDIHDGIIHITRSVNVDQEVTQGKNRNAIRPVYITPHIKRELDQQYLLTENCQTVFEVPTTDMLRDHWKRYAEFNGITKTTLYEMRHTFVSVAQALPEGLVKKIVGHSQSMDTWGTYAHLLDGQGSDTAARLEIVFDSIIK